jgi:HlyD family secretion protein
MRPIEDTGRLDDSEPRWNDEPQADGVGAQGEALILELQRLRQAFDDDDGQNRRLGRRSREGSEPDRHRRGNAPKRRRKGRMGQAIDVWLTQFGLKTPIEARSNRGDGGERSFGASASRRQRPTMVPSEPDIINRPVEGNAPRPRRRNPTIIPGEPAITKRPVEATAPRGPRAPSPTIAPGEPVIMKKRPVEGIEAYAPRRQRPTVTPGEPAVMRGPVEATDTRPPRLRNPTIPPGEPVVTKKRVGPTVAAPRRENPTIAHGDRIAMDLMKPGPVIPGPGGANQPMLLAKPGSEPPGAAKPETPATKLIEKSRTGLMAGVSFMLDHGAPPPPDNTPENSLTPHTRWSFERELRRGLRVLIVAAVLGGGWLVFVPLAGAVVVPGNLVVQSNVKQIQHPTGGVVAEIKAQNGSRVSSGDLLVRLDATQTQASLQVVTKQLDELQARMARLTAERDGLAEIEFPAELSERSGNDDIKKLLASEESLFRARSGSRQSQKDLLQSQAAQLAQQITGVESQLDSKAKQLDLIHGELAGVQDLYDKHLVPVQRLTTLQREAAQIDGERGQLTSAIAETKSKIDASQLQIVRIDQDFRSEVVKDLNEAQAKEAELSEHRVAARDQLDRIEIRAPTSGVVNQLSIHTIGGVIKAGETIMELVPDTDDLQIEARVQPKDIDHVRTGQKAFVRFAAFNQRTTPQLNGTVSYVSADTGHDQQTNAPYFTVRVMLPEDERRRLNGQQLVPGMPTEVFMQTGSRTMMSYLFEPITDQMRRAFVEQ